MNSKYKYQEAYDERHGLIAKTYKISKDLAERFKRACDSKGISQASKLQELMRHWLDGEEET